jgi:hypothetical protein
MWFSVLNSSMSITSHTLIIGLIVTLFVGKYIWYTYHYEHDECVHI